MHNDYTSTFKLPNIPGVIFTMFSGHCPFQAEGTIEHQGRRFPFYFRARGSIGLWIAGDEAGDPLDVGTALGTLPGWQLYVDDGVHRGWIGVVTATCWLRAAFAAFPNRFIATQPFEASLEQTLWWRDEVEGVGTPTDSSDD